MAHPSSGYFPREFFRFYFKNYYCDCDYPHGLICLPHFFMELNFSFLLNFLIGVSSCLVGCVYLSNWMYSCKPFFQFLAHWLSRVAVILINSFGSSMHPSRSRLLFGLWYSIYGYVGFLHNQDFSTRVALCRFLDRGYCPLTARNLSMAKCFTMKR